MAVYRCTNCGGMNRIPEPPPPGTPKCGRCHQALATDGAPQEVGDDSFDEAIKNAPVPVVVDFWAPWCPPCRLAGPIIESVAHGNAGKVLVLKVNTDESPRVAEKFGIASIPAFFVFRDGKVVAQQTGLPPQGELERWIARSTAG